MTLLQVLGLVLTFKMSKKLSLLEYCIPCNSTCCKHSDSIGTPMLDKKEYTKISNFNSIGNIKNVKLKNGEEYYIILEDEKGNCSYLNEEGRCRIQEVKPLDCAIYPIKAIYEGDFYKFVIDSDCPASFHLTKEFIEEAKRLSIISIKRFSKETYNHWLKNYLGWIEKSGKNLEDF